MSNRRRSYPKDAERARIAYGGFPKNHCPSDHELRSREQEIAFLDEFAPYRFVDGFVQYSLPYRILATRGYQPPKKTWLGQAFSVTHERAFEPELSMIRRVQGFAEIITRDESLRLKNLESHILAIDYKRTRPSDLSKLLEQVIEPIARRVHNEERTRIAAFLKAYDSQKQRERVEAATTSLEHRVITEAIKRELRVTETCPYCGSPMMGPHADHIDPISLGGNSHITNLVYVCWSCNLEKGSDSLRRFAQRKKLNFSQIRARLRKMGKEIPD